MVVMNIMSVEQNWEDDTAVWSRWPGRVQPDLVSRGLEGRLSLQLSCVPVATGLTLLCSNTPRKYLPSRDLNVNLNGPFVLSQLHLPAVSLLFFRCSECGCILSHWYYEREGQLYCKKHYWARYGEHCHGCKETISTGLIMVTSWSKKCGKIVVKCSNWYWIIKTNQLKYLMSKNCCACTSKLWRPGFLKTSSPLFIYFVLSYSEPTNRSITDNPRLVSCSLAPKHFELSMQPRIDW